MSKTYGWLVLDSGATSRREAVVTEISQRLAAGEICYAYLLDDAVRDASDPVWQNLKAHGLQLSACGYAALKRGLPLGEEVVYGGLVILGDLLARCDGFDSVDDRPSAEMSAFHSTGPGDQVICVVDERVEFCPRQGEPWRVASGLAATGLKITVVHLKNPAAVPKYSAEVVEWIQECRRLQVTFLENLPREISGRILWLGGEPHSKK